MLILCMVVLIVYGDLEIFMLCEFLFGCQLIVINVIFVKDKFVWFDCVWWCIIEEVVVGCQVYVVVFCIDEFDDIDV